MYYCSAPVHFLPRKINPAPIVPSEEELEGQDENFYGAFSMEEVGALNETLRERIQASEDLRKQLRSVENGFKLYVKSRQPASAQSCKRAKELPQEGCHPLFLRRRAGSNAVLLKVLTNANDLNGRCCSFKCIISVEEFSYNELHFKLLMCEGNGTSKLKRHIKSGVMMSSQSNKIV